VLLEEVASLACSFRKSGTGFHSADIAEPTKVKGNLPEEGSSPLGSQATGVA
jgi:hypothetical protein